MQATNKRTLLRYLLPSFSEFEFIFFTSLFISTLIAVIGSNIGNIFSFAKPFDSASLYFFLGCTLILFIFVWSMIVMAISAYRRPFMFGDVRERAKYVMFPTTILVLIGMVGLLRQMVSLDGNFSIIMPITALLTIRYVVLSILIYFAKYIPSLEYKIAEMFNDYQINKKEAFWAVLIGICGAVAIIISKDQLAWTITISWVGQELIRSYRDIQGKNVQNRG